MHSTIQAGKIPLDGLYTPMRYPGNYGFIPHTLCEHGDPCDILVANTRPIIPGAVNRLAATEVRAQYQELNISSPHSPIIKLNSHPVG
jgi:hypothetical protein